MQKGIREVLANEEISLTELFQLLLSKRKIIYISMVVILFFGIVPSPVLLQMNTNLLR